MFRGKLTNLSSEYFAITADISLILNKITEEDYTCDTPDGAGKDRDSCLTRLARVLCADREMVSDDELIDFANKLYSNFLKLIRENVDTIAKRYNLNDVVITGLGEEILKDALDGYNIISIKETYGKDVSLATPSFAVAKLLQKQLNE